jgi:hydroxylaminobenzene mutase
MRVGQGEDQSRRLMWHGVLLFFASLIAGAFVPLYENPRMGLSAHVGGVTAGTFLVVVGLVWTHLQLSPPAMTAGFWLTLYGSYVSSAGLLLAAMFGTSRSTPIAGAGHLGSPWQETVVAVTLVTSAAAMLAACVLLLRGLRREAGRA